MRALILEDVPPRSSLAGKLVQSGHLCETAATDRQCLIKCLARKPDIILVDLEAPGTKGILFLRHLARRFPTVRLVVTSALDDDDVMEKLFHAGVAAYLLKPTSDEILFSVLARLQSQGEDVTPSIRAAGSPVHVLAVPARP